MNYYVTDSDIMFHQVWQKKKKKPKNKYSYTAQLIKELHRAGATSTTVSCPTHRRSVWDPGHLVERSEPGFQQSIQTGEMDLQLDKSINSPVGTS